MKKVAINGTEYVKATDLAKDLGYTSDYVGQLCRGGKVKAEQIGRSWYVDPTSMQEHRASRYRSNQAKSREAVKAVLEHKENSARRTAAIDTRDKVTHLHVHTYESDETDLIPKISPAKTAVNKEVINSTPIKVKTNSKGAKLKPTARPEVVFKGSVSIEEVADDSETILKEFPQKVGVVNRPAAKGKNEVMVNDHNQTQSIPISSEHKRRGGYNILYSVTTLTLTVSVIILFMVSFLSFESEVVATDSGVESSYKLNFDDVATALKSVVE